MKLLRKPVQMIAWHDFDGTPHPVRFRYEDDGEQLITVKIQRSMKKDINKFAGKKILPFVCQAVINNEIRSFELWYGLDTCRWYLYKM